MKKSLAILMLGSTVLLSNNNSVEASNGKNEVQVQKAQYFQCVGFEEKVNKSYYSKNGNIFYKWYQLNQKQPVIGQEKVETPAPDKTETPAAKPAPVETPATPVEAEVEQTPTQPTESAQDASVSAIEKAVLDLTNAERQKVGLAPLQTDSNLMNSAREKSTDMATNGYFSHTSPTYGSPFDQMKKNGVTYKSAAENIAMGQRTAEEVVKGWMNSPGHKENILSPSYTHIGIGYDTNGHYWTQQFIGK